MKATENMACFSYEQISLYQEIYCINTPVETLDCVKNGIVLHKN